MFIRLLSTPLNFAPNWVQMPPPPPPTSAPFLEHLGLRFIPSLWERSGRDVGKPRSVSIIIGVFLKGRGPEGQMLLRSQVRLKGTFVEWPERHWQLRVQSLDGLLGWDWAELDGVSSKQEHWNCDCRELSQEVWLWWRGREGGRAVAGEGIESRAVAVVLYDPVEREKLNPQERNEDWLEYKVLRRWLGMDLNQR